MIEIGNIYIVGDTHYKVIGDSPPKQFYTPNKTWCTIAEKDGSTHGKYHVLNEYLN